MVIYTTNAVESNNMSVSKIIKNGSSFRTDGSPNKPLYLTLIKSGNSLLHTTSAPHL